MPEATMNEDHGLVHREDKIGFARKFSVVDPIAKSCSVKRTAKASFGFRILSTNAGHHPGSSFLVYNISHSYDLAFNLMCAKRPHETQE